MMWFLVLLVAASNCSQLCKPAHRSHEGSHSSSDRMLQVGFLGKQVVTTKRQAGRSWGKLSPGKWTSGKELLPRGEPSSRIDSTPVGTTGWQTLSIPVGELH